MAKTDDQPIRHSVVIENDNPPSGYHIRSIVTESHRLALYPGTDEGELFDLQADPHELDNLWNRPAAQSLRQQLFRQLLEDYARHTPWYPVPPWNS